MSKYIMLIEDKSEDYRSLNDYLISINSEYTLLPSVKDFKNFTYSVIHGSKSKCVDTIIKLFSEYKEDIVAVICDLMLEEHGYGRNGEDVIKIIRRDIEISGLRYYTKIIPIFIYTWAQDGQRQRIEALDSGATHLIEKKAGNSSAMELIKAIENTVDVFSRYREYGDIMNKANSSLSNMIISQQEISASVMYDAFRFIRDQLSVLMFGMIRGLGQSQREDLIKLYDKEIKNGLGEDKYMHIQESEWEKWKSSIMEINSNGGIKEFVNSTLDMLENVGLTDSAKGKLFSIMMKGVFGVLSSKK
jgi:hypothetical protein